MTTVILGLLMYVAIAVFIMMSVTVCLSHRSRPQAQASRRSLAVELIWNVVPWLILVGAVTPAVIGILRDSQAPPAQARVFATPGN
jgi:heme/copper-type cytochrome/quinol oxidase subunit 2